MNLTIKMDSFQFEFNKKAFRRELGLIGREVTKKVKALIKSDHASTPGGAPVSRTGDLVNSITFRRKGDKVTIKASEYYSLFLEAGAKGTGKSKSGNLLPRPYISLVLEDMKKEIQERLLKAINEGVTSK